MYAPLSNVCLMCGPLYRYLWLPQTPTALPADVLCAPPQDWVLREKTYQDMILAAEKIQKEMGSAAETKRKEMVSAAEMQVKEIAAKLSDSEKSGFALAKELEGAKREIEGAKKELSALRVSKADADSARTRAETESSAVEAKLKAAQSSLEKTKEALAMLRQSAADSDAGRKAAEQQSTLLVDKLAATERARDTARDAHADVAKQVAGLEEQFSAADASRSELEAARCVPHWYFAIAPTRRPAPAGPEPVPLNRLFDLPTGHRSRPRFARRRARRSLSRANCRARRATRCSRSED
jgi:hypothetical protein